MSIPTSQQLTLGLGATQPSSSTEARGGFTFGLNTFQPPGGSSSSSATSNNGKGFSFVTVSGQQNVSFPTSVSQSPAAGGAQTNASTLASTSSVTMLSSGLKFGSTASTASQLISSEQQKTGVISGLPLNQTSKPSLVTQVTQTATQPAGSGIQSTKSNFGNLGTSTTQSFIQLPIASTNTSNQNASSLAAANVMDKKFTYKQLEDIINKWVNELEDQEKVFLNQASQVNDWDHLLIENGEKITQLNTEIQRLKTDQKSLDRELDYILSKQQELEEMLIPLEEQMKEQQTVPYMQHADVEREKTYRMAENIDCQLKRMMQDLKDIISHINTSNTYLRDSDDPMAQIAKILNSHMDSLQWIDQHGMLLQRRVEDVSRQVENRRREHERSLRLTFT